MDIPKWDTAQNGRVVLPFEFFKYFLYEHAKMAWFYARLGIIIIPTHSFLTC